MPPPPLLLLRLFILMFSRSLGFKNTWPYVQHLLHATARQWHNKHTIFFSIPTHLALCQSAFKHVWPVRSPTTPMMQHQILVTHSLRPKTTAVTPVSAESLHNYKESFLSPIFFNTCIFTYLWSWYAFQKSRTYLPVPYRTNVTDSCTYKNSTQINHRMTWVLLE